MGDDENQLLRHREILMGGLLGVTNAAPVHPGEEFAAVSDEEEVISLLTKANRTGSLAGNLRSFRNAAYTVRDLWSPDSWRVIEAIIREWVEDAAAGAQDLDDYTDPLNRLIIHFTALLGLNLESMTRDAGWRLLDSGRRIERAQFLLGIIRNFLVEGRPAAEEQLVMETVLAASDSLVTYRKRYRTHPRIELVLELLLMEPNNARSLLYQIQRLAGEHRPTAAPARRRAADQGAAHPGRNRQPPPPRRHRRPRRHQRRPPPQAGDLRRPHERLARPPFERPHADLFPPRRPPAFPARVIAGAADGDGGW